MLRLRIDDVYYTRPERAAACTPEALDAMLDVCEKYFRPADIVLAVIPPSVSKAQLIRMRTRGNELALHGVTHQEDGPQDEFQWALEGRSGDEAVRAIETAIRLALTSWGDVRPTTYVPPRNCISLPTALALQRLGFQTILSGPGGDVETLHQIADLGLDVRYSSEDDGTYGLSSELLERGAVPKLRRLHALDEDVAPLTLHVPWEVELANGSMTRPWVGRPTYPVLEEFMKAVFEG